MLALGENNNDYALLIEALISIEENIKDRILKQLLDPSEILDLLTKHNNDNALLKQNEIVIIDGDNALASEFGLPTNNDIQIDDRQI